MQWPRAHRDLMSQLESVKQGIPESNLAHNDLHAENVVAGSSFGDLEHEITSLWKLIDFGSAIEVPYSRDAPSGEERNIRDIGKLMIGLTTHNELTDTVSANDILPLEGPNQRYPSIDPDLSSLIESCMEDDKDFLPDLQ
ncbi:hypothetical protein M426DRAFT_9701 [Hypoxylon sp. CI-4A]|nr:hypothetical protein M426DRAFT_9701 [Hypoxylon sp. CI-4A]